MSVTQDDQGVGADREPRQSLTVTDNRTGHTYELPVEDGAVRASELKKIKLDDDDDPGLASFDPGFFNTASCQAQSLSSTATRGSSPIGDIRSSSWRSSPTTWRWPTC